MCATNSLRFLVIFLFQLSYDGVLGMQAVEDTLPLPGSGSVGSAPALLSASASSFGGGSGKGGPQQGFGFGSFGMGGMSPEAWGGGAGGGGFAMPHMTSFPSSSLSVKMIGGMGGMRLGEAWASGFGGGLSGGMLGAGGGGFAVPHITPFSGISMSGQMMGGTGGMRLGGAWGRGFAGGMMGAGGGRLTMPRTTPFSGTSLSGQMMGGIGGGGFASWSRPLTRSFSFSSSSNTIRPFSFGASSATMIGGSRPIGMAGMSRGAWGGGLSGGIMGAGVRGGVGGFAMPRTTPFSGTSMSGRTMGGAGGGGFSFASSWSRPFTRSFSYSSSSNTVQPFSFGAGSATMMGGSRPMIPPSTHIFPGFHPPSFLPNQPSPVLGSGDAGGIWSHGFGGGIGGGFGGGRLAFLSSALQQMKMGGASGSGGFASFSSSLPTTFSTFRSNFSPIRTFFNTFKSSTGGSGGSVMNGGATSMSNWQRQGSSVGGGGVGGLGGGFFSTFFRPFLSSIWQRTNSLSSLLGGGTGPGSVGGLRGAVMNGGAASISNWQRQGSSVGGGGMGGLGGGFLSTFFRPFLSSIWQRTNSLSSLLGGGTGAGGFTSSWSSSSNGQPSAATTLVENRQANVKSVKVSTSVEEDQASSGLDGTAVGSTDQHASSANIGTTTGGAGLLGGAFSKAFGWLSGGGSGTSASSGNTCTCAMQPSAVRNAADVVESKYSSSSEEITSDSGVQNAGSSWSLTELFTGELGQRFVHDIDDLMPDSWKGYYAAVSRDLTWKFSKIPPPSLQIDKDTRKCIMRQVASIWFDGNTITTDDLTNQLENECSQGYEEVNELFNIAEADFYRLPATVQNLLRTAWNELLYGGFSNAHDIVRNHMDVWLNLNNAERAEVVQVFPKSSPFLITTDPYYSVFVDDLEKFATGQIHCLFGLLSMLRNFEHALDTANPGYYRDEVATTFGDAIRDDVGSMLEISVETIGSRIVQKLAAPFQFIKNIFSTGSSSSEEEDGA